jgi:hypothetical protein
MSFLSSTPVPTPSPTIDPALVTPGTAGWIVVALLALAVVLLAVDMLRRVKYREEINEALDAEQSAAEDGDVSPR